MKIIDFDKKFFEFARKWVAAHPGMTEKQIDESYNRMMEAWLSEPADWLDGAAPKDYFRAYSDPAELMALMEGYSEAGINLPEPLYSRIVELGEACAPALAALLADASRAESLRAEAMGMLRDMSSHAADECLIDLVCGAEEANELSDMAEDNHHRKDAGEDGRLLDAYNAEPEYARTLILDVCANFPGDERIYERLIWRLKNVSEQRALHASYLAKLGDPRAIDVLSEMLKLFDLSYFDYIELRDAVEALGGEIADERTFYGDPDYEALRGIE